MAVQRIEWQCPGCGKKFAIPEQTPRPKLCPNCQKTRSVPPPRPPASAPTMPAVNRGVPVEFVEEEEEFAPPPVLPGPQAPASRPARRRRYQELRTLSVVLKILAALIGLMTIVLVVDLGMDLNNLPAGEPRKYAVYTCLALLIGGTTTALLVFSFSTVLLVAVDVEYNTRND